MDLFLATCQGIGLALAVGGAAGALAGIRGEVGGGAAAALVAVALIAGGFLFGDSLSSEDHPAWPGWLAGALVALLGFFVAQGIVAGAAARARERRLGLHARGLRPRGGRDPRRALVVRLAGRARRLRRRRVARDHQARRARKHEGLRVLR